MFKHFITIFTLIFLFHSTAVWANRLIATVAKVRGVVTVLQPGALTARKVRVGDKLYEDSSLLTHQKSFVRVKYLDGSILNLGPKSKMVLVELEKKTQVGVVSLLKGTLRASIQKKTTERETKNKFFVKTRTAALGVRGTQFQTIFNPENEATSLVTFEGKVAMVKVDEKFLAKQKLLVVDEEQEQLEEEKVDKLKKAWNSNKVDAKSLDKVLASKETVVVKQGQYSGVTEGLEKTTLPVKISPKQFTVLYYNKEFSKIDPKKIKNTIPQAEQSVPLEGIKNDKTGDFAPRAGGYIDPETALYIPPKKDSKLNRKLKVYEDKDIGKIDAATGKYIPPKGLKLDAKKGFVIDKSALKKEQKLDASKLIVMKETLNKTIAAEVVLKKKIAEKQIYAMSMPKMWARNYITYSFAHSDYTWHINKVEDDSLTASRFDQSVDTHRFAWSQNGHGKWQLETAFMIKDGTSKDDYWLDDSFDNFGDSTYSLELAIKYLASMHSTFALNLLIDQNNYIAYTYDDNMGDYTLSLEKVTLLKIMASYYRRFLEYKRFYFDMSIALGFAKPKDSGVLDLQVQYLSNLELGANYWLSTHYWLRLGIQHKFEIGEVEGEAVKSTLSREEFAVGLRLGYVF